MADTNIDGRTVPVTGGARGIGAAVSRAFAAESSRAVIHQPAAGHLDHRSGRGRARAVSGACTP